MGALSNPSSPAIVAGLDIGDVNVLNAAGTKVNPATSDLQTTGNAVLVTMDADTGAIKTAVELIDNAIAGTEMQVDVVAALPTGTNSIGQVTANAGTNLNTSLLALEAGGNLATIAGDTTNIEKCIMGASAPTIDSYTSAVVDCAAGATTDVIAAPGASKQLWIYGLLATADTAAGTIVLLDSTPTSKSGTMAVSDEGGWVLPLSGNFAMPWVKCATNTKFQITTVSSTFDGIVSYAIVSV